MRKLWVVLVLACVLGCVGGETLAAEAKVPVYLNGEKSEITAVAVNGVSYLPLRDLAEVFALDISWDGEQRLVDIYGLEQKYRVWLGREVYGSAYLDGEEEKWFEQELEGRPLLLQGRVWLPLAAFQDFSEASVYWVQEQPGIFVNGVPVWQEGRWTISEAGPAEDYLALDFQGNRWVALRQGSPIMGKDYLWRLSPTGEKQRVLSEYIIGDVKAIGNACYYLAGWNAIYPEYKVWQVDSFSGERTALGEPGFVYNMGVIRSGQELYLTYSGKNGVGWWVDFDGVWAMGLDSGAIVDAVIDDEALARESYGLYRLYPGGHELVKKYDLP